MVDDVLEIQESNVKELGSENIEEEKQLSKLDILKKLSPGTGLRVGLNNIVHGRLGAIILIENKNTLGVFKGGFKVNCKFSSKRLAELAKLDGGMVLSEDFKKILYINTLFVPDSNLKSSETGTRHQAAERVAKQTGALVIAVSERRRQITIYYGESRYVLQNTEDLLRKATETLQILEKQREVFNELLINMNILEVTNLVSVGDVCTILQRLEMIREMANIINEYIIELGREGIIVRMRMRELTKGIDEKRDLIIRDYGLRPIKVKQFFNNLSFEGLLDSENIARLLFGESSEMSVVPNAYRILSKTNLNASEIRNLIVSFKNLEGIFNADEETLRKVLKGNTENFLRGLGSLKEQILMGRKV